MQKVYELVVVGFMVGVLGAAAFEVIKERFLGLRAVWKGVILVSGFSAACVIAFFLDDLPVFEATELHIPFPIPTYTKTTIPIRGSVVGAFAVAIAVFILALSRLADIKPYNIGGQIIIDREPMNGVAYVASKTSVSLITIISLLYKILVISSNGLIQSPIMAAVLFVSVFLERAWVYYVLEKARVGKSLVGAVVFSLLSCAFVVTLTIAYLH